MAGEEAAAIESFKAKLGGFYTRAAREKGLGIKPRDGDVFICTPPKCGTTWVQQIVHQLRTGGSMDFEEISCVIPWLETAGDIGIDVDEHPQPTPRCFKTHAWRHHLADIHPEAKYIVIVRDPIDAGISFYHFMSGWFFTPGSISIDTFIQSFFFKRGVPENIMQNCSWWAFLTSWWEVKEKPNVLWLHYEDMRRDHPGSVRRIASFLGYGDDALIDTAIRHSTFDFMKEHEAHFDEHVWKAKRNAACGLEDPKAGQGSSKVMHGKGSRRALLSQETIAMFHERWKVAIADGPVGIASYEAMVGGKV